MKHDLPTTEDLGRLLRHRLTIPAVLWAIAVLAACLTVLFDDSAPPEAHVTAAPTKVVSAR